MTTLTLHRSAGDAFGTFGHLVCGSQVFITGELNWHNNKPRRSCIPTGEYICCYRNSKRLGPSYQLRGVPNRSFIMIHRGNHCGDVSRGLKSDVEGCILLGLGYGMIEGQPGVMNSREAVDKFIATLQGLPFRLVIQLG